MGLERFAQKYQTRDPYKLLDAIGAVTHFDHSYDPNGLKGFSTILNRVMFAVINGHLNEHDRRIVSGHDAHGWEGNRASGKIFTQQPTAMRENLHSGNAAQ